jgi:hypothetical protein
MTNIAPHNISIINRAPAARRACSGFDKNNILKFNNDINIIGDKKHTMV